MAAQGDKLSYREVIQVVIKREKNREHILHTDRTTNHFNHIRENLKISVSLTPTHMYANHSFVGAGFQETEHRLWS